MYIYIYIIIVWVERVSERAGVGAGAVKVEPLHGAESVCDSGMDDVADTQGLGSHNALKN